MLFRSDQHARAQHAAQQLLAAPAVGHAVFGGVADEAARVAHFVHHAVAGVDAGGAADAFVLQAVADVDAHGADLHAQGAVDAFAQALRLVVGFFGACAARLATGGVVGDDEGVFVEHGALKARVGAHVFADLLAHVPGVAVGGEGVEKDPEGFPGAGRL